MGTEIERKFLVVGDSWRDGAVGRRLVQGYLSRDPARTVRIRLDDDAAFLTIKGQSVGASRAEFEYPLPRHDAEPLLALCLPPLIDKRRFVVELAGKRWEIDEFAGDNAPLVLAELELTSEDEAFDAPHWLGREVTADPRFFNSQLAHKPYASWREEE
ncbi:MAG: CYTH domain-containing protein [Myxococcales bacterium]|nr:CYTH domain-containing protein [Myxococcales bacterium]